MYDFYRNDCKTHHSRKILLRANQVNMLPNLTKIFFERTHIN